MPRCPRARPTLDAMIDSALAAVEPSKVIRHYLEANPHPETTHVIGVGKAAEAMARGALERLPLPAEVIIRHGDALPDPHPEITIFEAGHPLPDAASVAATAYLIERAHAMTSGDSVLFLLSGGASAMLAAPAASIPLSDLRTVNTQLLHSGASIDEINTVRRHLSQIKGGQLARIFHPARVDVLVFSDSVSDNLFTIGSGPLAADPTTFRDALRVLDHYDLRAVAPKSVVAYLDAGHHGDHPETVKPDDPALVGVRHAIVSSRREAAAAAARAASRRCWDAHAVDLNVHKDATSLGRWLVEQGLKHPSGTCLVFAGEATVAVRGDGTGGRNQETALAAAIALDALPESIRLTVASVATDGVDGPTSAAGAVVDRETLRHAHELGLDPADFLARNDSHTFFAQLDALITTGPTRTNVNDVMVVLVE